MYIAQTVTVQSGKLAWSDRRKITEFLDYVSELGDRYSKQASPV